MTALLLAQLAARWGQTLVLLVLSAAATTAAASVPVYAAAADRAVLAAEVAAADRTELMVWFGPHRREWSGSPGPDPAPGLLDRLDGFVRVVTTEVPVDGVRAAAPGRPEVAAPAVRRLVAEEDVCDRVVFGEGRCPAGNREAALPAPLAAATGLSAGDEVTLTPVDAPAPGARPAGSAVTFSLVGIFTPRGAGPLTGGDGALHTNHQTLRTMAHGPETWTVAAFLPPDRLDPDRLGQLRADLDRVARESALLARGGPVPLETGIPQLLERIDAGSGQVRGLLPVAALPLLGACWLVVNLAVRHGTAGRRTDLGLVAVRGAPPRVRVGVLAAGSLLPVVVAAPPGLLAAHLLVAAAGPAGGWVGRGPGQWLAVAVAVAGCAVAVLLGLRRELAAPAVSLLRRVPERTGRRGVAGAEALAVVLAVAAVVQLRWFGGGELRPDRSGPDGRLRPDPPGLDQAVETAVAVVPALVVLAVAVLSARASGPVLRRSARRWLGRGRLGRGVAATLLARRPGTARLIVVLAVATGVLGFAAVEAGAAAGHRATQPERVLGASRVLDLRPVDPARLLEAVRAADPEGRYAMAAVAVAPLSPDQPPGLALDTPRLARVAAWLDGYGPPAAEVVARVRPPAAAPVRVADGALVVDVSRDDPGGPGSRGGPGDRGGPDRTTVSVALAGPGGERPVVVRFGPVAPGRAIYREPVSGCARSCRLVDLAVSTGGGGPPTTAVTWHGIRQAGAHLLPGGWLTDSRRWRPLDPTGDPTIDPTGATGGGATRLSAGPAGLTITVDRPRSGARYRVGPPDTPYPLPVAATADLAAGRVGNLDGRPVAVAPAVRLAGLPGLGASGVLMDLEYAVRSAHRTALAGSPQVWLAAGAPPGVVDRLGEHGLVVSGDRSAAGLRARMEGSAVAMAVRYHLVAGALAVVVGAGALGLVAAVDRRTWAPWLLALRAQGLSRRTAGVAALFPYGSTVVLGAAAGGVAALAAWLAAGDRLPVGEPGAWPAVGAWLAPWSAGVAALVAVAVAAAWWQGVELRRAERRAGGRWD